MILHLFCFRYGRWVTRRVAVVTIATIWLLAALISFVPISLGLHRPKQPLVYHDEHGKHYPTCALDLTPSYAVVSSCISFYVPCIVMIGMYRIILITSPSFQFHNPFQVFRDDYNTISRILGILIIIKVIIINYEFNLIFELVNITSCLCYNSILFNVDIHCISRIL